VSTLRGSGQFPVAVREAAGLRRSSVGGRVLSTTVDTVQTILTTAVGGAIVYPLARLLGWLP